MAFWEANREKLLNPPWMKDYSKKYVWSIQIGHQLLCLNGQGRPTGQLRVYF